jgi:mono/diheme cytochrome c family protein
MTMSLQTRCQPVLALALAAGLALALPVSASAEELGGYDGVQLYKRLCASCHGPEGAGDGPVAASLRNRPPDLAGIAARRGGQFPDDKLRQIIDGRAGVAAHGGRDMPVWGNDLKLAGADPEALITRLVGHLRTLQKPGRR